MVREAWQATVHGVTRGRPGLATVASPALKTNYTKEMLEPPLSWGFPGGSHGKESICNARDLGSIPGSGRSPGEGKGKPLQYSGLENSTGREGYGPQGHKELDTTERWEYQIT